MTGQTRVARCIELSIPRQAKECLEEAVTLQGRAELLHVVRLLVAAVPEVMRHASWNGDHFSRTGMALLSVLGRRSLHFAPP